MTRGRDSNHAYVVVEDNQTALDVATQAVTRDWIDQPAVARRDQLDHHRHRARLTVDATEPEALDPTDPSDSSNQTTGSDWADQTATMNSPHSNSTSAVSSPNAEHERESPSAPSTELRVATAS